MIRFESLDDIIEMSMRAMDLVQPDSMTDRLLNYLYTPHPQLSALVQRVLTRRSRGDLSDGRDLEGIAWLAFGGLRGVDEIRCYSTPGPQIDLLVRGSGIPWGWVVKYLYDGASGPTGILVEAKDLAGAAEDHHFARLCGIMEGNFRNDVALGVFLSPAGATGFPRAGRTTRNGGIRAARLRQLLHYARTSRAIVVIESGDLEALVQPGGLLRLLQRKRREVSQMTELPVENTPGQIIDAPAYLRKYEAG